MKNMKWIVSLVAVLLLLATFASSAGAVVRVGGDEINREYVEAFARLIMNFKGESMPPSTYAEALQKAATNRAVSLVARKEMPELVKSVERSVDISLSENYYSSYYAKVAMPQAEKNVTLDAAVEKTPEQEAVAYLYVIVMGNETELEKVRAEIASGALSFQDAAKKYSQGASGKRGGELGGVKRSDDRYSEAVKELLFSMPLGEVSEVIKTTLGYSVFRVEDRKSAEEHRRILAMSSLPTMIGAEASRLCWKVYEEAKGAGRVKMFLNDENTIGKSLEPLRPAFEIDGATYYVEDIIRGSGGAGAHGSKDVLTIAENRSRDLVLRRLHIEKYGLLEEERAGRALLMDHNITRRYLNAKTADITVDDQAVDAYLAQNQDKYGLPLRADLGLIYVKNEYRLKQVQDDLAAGKDFEEVAKAWSQDKKYARMGGRLGIIPILQVGGDIASLTPGGYTAPLHVTEGDNPGYFIFKLYRLLPAEPGTRQNLPPEVVGGARSMVLAGIKEERLGKIISDAVRQVGVENMEAALREIGAAGGAN